MTEGGAALVALDAALTAAWQANGARAAAAPAGAPAGAVAIDLAGLTRFDSAALAVLLELGRRHGAGPADAPPAAPDGAANRFGRTLFLLNPPAKLLDLARLYGLADLMFGRQG